MGRQDQWVCSKVSHAVYAYALPDLTLRGGVKVWHHPDWLTFTPGRRRVSVANAGSNSVSVVDIATRTEVARVPVGQVPKRNITARLPQAAPAWSRRRTSTRRRRGA